MNQQVQTMPAFNLEAMPKDVRQKYEILQSQVATLELCRQLGHHYAQTDMVPKAYKGKPEDAAVAIQWGMEIGLQPLQSLQNIAVINGTPTLWGDALVALVKQSGQCEYINTIWDEGSLTATVKTQRKKEPEETRTYSMADAQQAGLADRQTYRQHGKRMIQTRARSFLLRDVYADVLKGFQVREVVEEDEEVKKPDREGGEEKDITPGQNHQNQQSARPALELYPQEKFDQNFDRWVAAITSGKKSHDDLINMVEHQAKAAMTEEQKQLIREVAA